jgi:hypothetical protein
VKELETKASTNYSEKFYKKTSADGKKAIESLIMKEQDLQVPANAVDCL